MESAEKEFRILESLRCETDKVYHQLARPFQNAGVEVALDNLERLNFTLLAYVMGAGKTFILFMILNQLKKRTVIFGPKIMLPKYLVEAKKWDYYGSVQLITKDSDFRKEADCYVVSYDYAKLHISKLHSLGIEVCVQDEIHMCKSVDSIRTQRILSFCQGKKNISLTGTPFVKGPCDIYPILSYLCPESIDNASFFAFAKRYTRAFQDSYGWRFEGLKNGEELAQRLRVLGGMIRPPREKILGHLPKFSVEVVKLNSDYQKTYFDREELANAKIDIPFDKISEMRSAYAEAKIAPSIEYIKLLLEEGEKLVVFAHHKKVVDAVVEEFTSLRLDGSMNSCERQRSIDSFQNNDGEKMIVCSLTSAGVGIELTASSVAVFVEYDWAASTNDQCIARMVRQGQEKFVRIFYLVVADTLDEYIISTNIKKMDISERILKN